MPTADQTVLTRIPAAGLPQLTRRQRELLHLLAQGYDNRKIAQTTGLSVKTIENHLTRLYRSLGVYSRSEALSYLMRHPEVLASTGQDIAENAAAVDAGAIAFLDKKDLAAAAVRQVIDDALG